MKQLEAEEFRKKRKGKTARGRWQAKAQEDGASQRPSLGRGSSGLGARTQTEKAGED